MACDPQSLVGQPLVTCFSCAVPEAQQLSIAIYELCLIAGQPTDKASLQTLTNNARCLACALSENGIATPGQQMAVAISILCQIAGLTPAPPPTPPAACSDADANAFLSATGISDTTTVNAVCALVIALKNAGIWTLMDVIYPFVGGTSVTNSYNLKNPAAFRITWHPTVTFNSAGVTGDGVSGFGDTGYNPTAVGGNYTLNSASLGFYTNPAGNGWFLSASNGASSISRVGFLTGVATMQGLNSAAVFSTGPALVKGMYVATRTDAATGVFYQPGQTNNDNSASTLLPTNNYFLLADNTNGVAGGFNAGTLSLATIGAGLNATQAAALQAAATAFNTSFSRA